MQASVISTIPPSLIRRAPVWFAQVPGQKVTKSGELPVGRVSHTEPTRVRARDEGRVKRAHSLLFNVIP